MIEEFAQSALCKGKVNLECVRWDDKARDLPLDSLAAAQDSVDQWIGTANECDLTIVILWKRLGTSFQASDGTDHKSGTVKEFYDGLMGGKAPWLFFCTNNKVGPDPKSPSFEDDLLQLKEAYNFAMGRVGSPVISKKTYDTPSDFERILRQNLRIWLEAKLLEGPELAWANYRAHLISDVSETPLPLFESVSPEKPVTLKSVYLPVHAWYDGEPETKDERRLRFGVGLVSRWIFQSALFLANLGEVSPALQKCWRQVWRKTCLKLSMSCLYLLATSTAGTIQMFPLLQGVQFVA
ncbi:MAG: hypothetical protein ACKVH0_00720 [Alphaproteobacteria bacterium]